jgi:ATP-dependent HslUV protease ATP-binding subunit HslU
VLEEVSFAAADRAGDSLTVDADYVQVRVGELSHNADLSRFIL